MKMASRKSYREPGSRLKSAWRWVKEGVCLAIFLAGAYALVYLMFALDSLEPLEPQEKCFPRAAEPPHCRSQYDWGDAP